MKKIYEKILGKSVKYMELYIKIEWFIYHIWEYMDCKKPLPQSMLFNAANVWRNSSLLRKGIIPRILKTIY